MLPAASFSRRVGAWLEDVLCGKREQRCLWVWVIPGDRCCSSRLSRRHECKQGGAAPPFKPKLPRWRVAVLCGLRGRLVRGRVRYQFRRRAFDRGTGGARGVEVQLECSRERGRVEDGDGWPPRRSGPCSGAARAELHPRGDGPSAEAVACGCIRNRKRVRAEEAGPVPTDVCDWSASHRGGADGAAGGGASALEAWSHEWDPGCVGCG